MLTRFFAVLLLLLALETVAFLQAHNDLIALRDGPEEIARGGETRVRALAAATLARRRLTRDHLETLAAAAQARNLVDVEILTLERLRLSYPTDRGVALRLADAYRRAKQYDAAAALYSELIAGVQR